MRNLEKFVGHRRKLTQNKEELKLKHIKFERRVMIGTSILTSNELYHYFFMIKYKQNSFILI